MNCRLSSRISSSNHRDIMHESRLAKCRIKDTHANKALQGGDIEALVLGAGRNEHGGRCDFHGRPTASEFSSCRASTSSLPIGKIRTWLQTATLAGKHAVSVLSRKSHVESQGSFE